MLLKNNEKSPITYHIIVKQFNYYMVVGSTTGKPYDPTFKTYMECKHFIGYWNLLWNDLYCNDDYDNWTNKYYHNNKFNGKLSDFDFSLVSLPEDNLFDKIKYKLF